MLLFKKKAPLARRLAAAEPEDCSQVDEVGEKGDEVPDDENGLPGLDHSGDDEAHRRDEHEGPSEGDLVAHLRLQDLERLRERGEDEDDVGGERCDVGQSGPPSGVQGVA